MDTLLRVRFTAQHLPCRQVVAVLDQAWAEGSHVRIMPDCHSGKGCVIGYTARLTGRVVPNLIGVDIGCGVRAWNMGRRSLSARDFEVLDAFIKSRIPSGMGGAHAGPVAACDADVESVCRRTGNRKRPDYLGYVARSVGTLGGGNHFIEIDLEPLARRAGVQLLVDSIGAMDADRRCVALADARHLEFDLLSLDVGSEIDISQLEALGSRLLPLRPLGNFLERWLRVLAAARCQPGFRVAVVGAGAQLFGAPRAPKHVAPFAWGGDTDERLTLETLRTKVTVRQSKGASIRAACGQLAGRLRRDGDG